MNFCSLLKLKLGPCSFSLQMKGSDRFKVRLGTILGFILDFAVIRFSKLFHQHLVLRGSDAEQAWYKCLPH